MQMNRCRWTDDALPGSQQNGLLRTSGPPRRDVQFEHQTARARTAQSSRQIRRRSRQRQSVHAACDGCARCQQSARPRTGHRTRRPGHFSEPIPVRYSRCRRWSAHRSSSRSQRYQSTIELDGTWLLHQIIDRAIFFFFVDQTQPLWPEKSQICTSFYFETRIWSFKSYFWP